MKKKVDISAYFFRLKHLVSQYLSERYYPYFSYFSIITFFHVGIVIYHLRYGSESSLNVSTIDTLDSLLFDLQFCLKRNAGRK